MGCGKSSSSDYTQPPNSNGAFKLEFLSEGKSKYRHVDMGQYFHWRRESNDYGIQQLGADHLNNKARHIPVHDVSQALATIRLGYRLILVAPLFAFTNFHTYRLKDNTDIAEKDTLGQVVYYNEEHGKDSADPIPKPNWPLITELNKSWWEQFAKTPVESGGHIADYVDYLYPIDEPLLNFNRVNLDVNIAYEFLEKGLQSLKIATGNKSIMVAVTHEEATSDNHNFPASFDIVGYDCYKSLLNCGGDKIFEIISKMESGILSEHQKIMLIPEAWYDPAKILEKNESGLSESEVFKNYEYDINSRLKMNYEIAINDPRIVYFKPFVWTSAATDGMGNVLKGANEIESIQETLFTIFDQLMNATPQMPKTEYGDQFTPEGKIEKVYLGVDLQTAVNGDKASQNRYIWGTKPDEFGDYLTGYAFEQDHEHLPTNVKVFANNTLVATMATNVRRPDINKTLTTVGVHGFVISLKPEWKGQKITLYAENHDSGDKVCEYTICTYSTSFWTDKEGWRKSIPNSAHIGPGKVVFRDQWIGDYQY